jgi:uncharacterized protein YdeI (YjbR/CyaY-like superfamily)
MRPVFFPNKSDLREWFEKNSQTEQELIIGYYKKASGKPSVDWSQSVDEALCFGWIDGIRKRIDDERYQIRFTPRNPKSHWSKVNIEKAENLIKQGLMKPAGLQLFKDRDKQKSGQASYERKQVALRKDFAQLIKRNKKAWNYFDKKLAPSYKKASIHWVMSAKQEETKLRRLNILIDSSEKEEKIPPLIITKKTNT